MVTLHAQGVIADLPWQVPGNEQSSLSLNLAICGMSRIWVQQSKKRNRVHSLFLLISYDYSVATRLSIDQSKHS